MKLNEGSVAITHGEIEYLLVFLKNKNNLEELKKSYKNDTKIDIRNYIDVNEFEKKYGYKIKNVKPYGRCMEATSTFIDAIKSYYNIDLIQLSEEQLMDFLNFYIKEFPNFKSYTKLNVSFWGFRSVEIKTQALKNLIKHVKSYNSINNKIKLNKL